MSCMRSWSSVRALRQRRRFLPTLLLPLLLLGAPLARGQDEGMPSADEIAEMMKQAQEAMKEMENLDPETRAQMEQALGAMSGGAPSGDMSPPPAAGNRLAKVSNQPLSPTELKAHVDLVAQKLDRALEAEALQRARSVLAETQRSGDPLASLRAAANGLAAMGFWPEATWLMAQLATRSGDVEDLSNLAAFLVVQLAEPAALPVLHTLDARYPDNSTILNNLGQAYYQLGDTARAETFLVAAVNRSPQHPQANATRGGIQQARGEMAAAQASLHAALAGGYSESKAQALAQSGGELTMEDVRWKLPRPVDPLGSGSMAPEIYPENVDSLPMLIALKRTANQQAREQAEGYAQRAAAIPPPNLAAMAAAAVRPFAARATKLLQLDAEQQAREVERNSVHLVEAMRKLGEERAKLDRKIAEIDAAGEEQYKDIPGGYQFDYTCGEVKSAIEAFLLATVPDLRTSETELADITYRHLNERVYFSQFVLPASEFERAQMQARATASVSKVGAQGAIDAVSGVVEQRNIACWQTKPKQAKLKLRNYNNINCNYITEFKIPGIGSMSFRCDVAEASFEPPFAPFEVKWKQKYTGKGDEVVLQRISAAVSVGAAKVGGHSEFDSQGWKSGGVSVTGKVGLGPKVGSGPLEIGTSASITGTLEFDRNGLSDAGVSGGLGAKATSTVAQTDSGHMQSELSADVKSSWSWSSGFNTKASTGFDSSVLDP